MVLRGSGVGYMRESEIGSLRENEDDWSTACCTVDFEESIDSGWVGCSCCYCSDSCYRWLDSFAFHIHGCTSLSNNMGIISRDR